VNPSGRLPISFLRSAGAAPLPYWRALGTDVYVDGSSAALYPFGHGISYTTFDYDDLEIESTAVTTDGVIRLAFTVTNTGERAGEEVVQIYGQDVVGRTVRPARTLIAFRRVSLEAAGSVRVVVDVPTSLFALWDARDGWVVEPGAIRLFVGRSSADIRLTDRVELTGSDYFPGHSRALTSTVTLADGGATFADAAAKEALDASATAR
jgi:beta-glucosidase